MVKVMPIGNRIAAIPLPVPEKSRGGILLPTGKDAKSVRFAAVKRFRVVAVEQGIQDPETGEWRRTTSLKPGDIITTGMYPGHSVPEVKVDGETLWFIDVGNAKLQELE